MEPGNEDGAYWAFHQIPPTGCAYKTDTLFVQLQAAALALTMAPHGSEITVLSTDGNSQSAGSASTLRSSKNCKLRVVKGTPTAYADLEKARVFEMDAVIVMPDFSQAKSKSEEDAGVLATYVLGISQILTQRLPPLRDCLLFTTYITSALFYLSAGDCLSKHRPIQ